MKTLTGRITIRTHDLTREEQVAKLLNDMIDALVTNGFENTKITTPLDFEKQKPRDKALAKAQAAAEESESPFIMATLANAQANADQAEAAELTADLLAASHKQQAELLEYMRAICQQLNSITDCLFALTSPAENASEE